MAFETQLASAGNSYSDTVLNNAWIAAGTNFIANYTNSGHPLTPNALSLALYQHVVPGGSQQYRGRDSTTGLLRRQINTIASTASASWTTTSTIRSLSPFASWARRARRRPLRDSYYPQFFQTAPMHIFNFSVIQDSIISPHLLNQSQLGTNYFFRLSTTRIRSFYPGTERRSGSRVDRHHRRRIADDRDRRLRRSWRDRSPPGART